MLSPNKSTPRFAALGLLLALAQAPVSAQPPHPAASAATTTAHGEEGAHEGENLVLYPTVDIPLTLGAGALFVTLFLTPHRQQVLADQTVGPPKGLDKLGVLKLNDGIASFSDYLLFGGVAAGLALTSIEGAHHGKLLSRSLIFLETLMVIGVATELSKWAVRRARPYTLGSGQRLGVPDDDLSFFSGHTSFSAGWSFAAVRILDLSHRWPAWMRALGYGGASLLTVGMASLRVAAGKHWPTDVLVGALVGGSLGFLVPELHRSKLPIRLAAAPAPGGAQLSLNGLFY